MLAGEYIGVYTVLVLIKLTKFAVPVRSRCGSTKLIFFVFISSFIAMFKNVVHSLELQTMCNILKIRKILFFQFT